MLQVLLLRRSKVALAEVYRRHGDATYSAARAVSTQTATADDLTCARFVELWHNPAAYDPQLGSLRSFLIGGLPGRASGALPAGGAGFGSPARTAGARHHPAVAHVLLEGLPVHEALAIDLAVFGQHTCRQIAHLLDEPERRICGRIRDGLYRLAGGPPTGRRSDRREFV